MVNGDVGTVCWVARSKRIVADGLFTFLDRSRAVGMGRLLPVHMQMQERGNSRLARGIDCVFSPGMGDN